MSEHLAQFEQRKRDHLRLALDSQAQALGLTGLDQVRLIHEALPEIDFAKVKTVTEFLGHQLNSPVFISSMTAGHEQGFELNLALARAAARRGWMMGVGSQRKQLTHPEAAKEWKSLRSQLEKEGLSPVLMGNLGLAQVIQTPLPQIQKLVDSLQASALFVHTNPLQEALQKEGTPNFERGLWHLEQLCKGLSVPVVLKEVGCGFSKTTLNQLRGLGLYAVDVAGLGGTHWGRIEGLRSAKATPLYRAAMTFQNWGTPTVESVLAAQEFREDYQVWASGGVRSGLDVAKLVAMGASMVGVAQPILNAAFNLTESASSASTLPQRHDILLSKLEINESTLDQAMEDFELELRIAMFCTGCEDLNSFSSKKVWTWI